MDGSAGFLIFVLWIVFAIVVGLGAKAKGRSEIGWFLLALFVSPLIAGLFILGSSNLRAEEVAEQIQADSKTCPRCAERVKRAASVCRYCNHEFVRYGQKQKLSLFGSPETAAAELRRLGYIVTFDGINGRYFATPPAGEKRDVGRAPEFVAWACQRIAETAPADAK